MLRKKWLISVLLIVTIGLAGCGAPAEKEVVANVPVVEEVTEETETGAEEVSTESEDTIEDTVKEEVTETEVEEMLEVEEEPAQEQEEPAPATQHVIDFSAISAQLVESESEATPFTMTIVSEKANNVSEIPDWLTANDLTLPMLGGAGNSFATADENAPTVTANMLLCGSAFYDENYIYDWTDTGLSIYDRNTGMLLHAVSYQMDRWYFMGNCASLQDGILYMGYLYNGYAMPGTCYLLAYDLENEKVLWRSEDQTYNTMNFIVKDDVIICGYGFTDEKDFLYQIDKNTGKVVGQQELKKKPELLVEKDGQIYVHSYSYDYVVELRR